MRFADKYEILGEIPAGRVATFVAKDVVTGERVLIHIFDPEGPSAPTYSVTNQSSMQTCGEPARPSSTEGQTRFVDRGPTDGSPAPREATPPGPMNEPGEFTRQFSAVSRKDAGQPALGRPAKEPEELSAQRFRSEQRIEYRNEVPAPTLGNGTIGLGGATMLPGDGDGITAQFRAAMRRESSPVGSNDAPKREESQSFTDFFGGPFDGGNSAGPSVVPSRPPEKAPDKTPGEFTAVFGGDENRLPPREKDADAGGTPGRPQAFVQNTVRDDVMSNPAPARLPVGPGNSPVNQFPVRLSAKETPGFAAPVSPSPSPVMPEPRPGKLPVKPSSTSELEYRGGGHQATSIFSAPAVAESAQIEPAGMSAYTQIISGGQASRGGQASEPAEVASPSGPTSKAALPALPAAPKMPPPPKSPAPPKLGAPKQKTSYLSLILILSNLFLVALLMILYFVLRR
jgi:hypothetical protein